MSRAARQRAAELVRYMGTELGVRRSLAEIARELPTLSRRTPLTGEIVRRMMNRFAAAGLVAPAEGPRGGEGWVLTESGALLAAELYGDRAAGRARESKKPAASTAARPARKPRDIKENLTHLFAGETISSVARYSHLLSITFASGRKVILSSAREIMLEYGHPPGRPLMGIKRGIADTATQGASAEMRARRPRRRDAASFL